MDLVERNQTRLDNIRSVQPVLSALRTISLGRWQSARKQQVSAQEYQSSLLALLPWLLPQLLNRPLQEPPTLAKSGRVMTLVIGSERGLCGRFNAALIKRLKQYLAGQEKLGTQVPVASLGTRLTRNLQAQDIDLAWTEILPKTPNASVELVFRLTQQWLIEYEAYELDAVDLIYNRYQGLGRFQPTLIRLLPPSIATAEGSSRPSLAPAYYRNGGS